MKVKLLIKILQSHDEDTTICIRDTSGNIVDIDGIEVARRTIREFIDNGIPFIDTERVLVIGQ